MKISFAISVCHEVDEIKRLVPFILEHKRPQDEIVVLYDQKNGDEEVIKFLLSYNIKPNIQIWRSFDFDNDFAKWKNKLNLYCTGDYILQLDADEMISEYMVKNVSEIISLNPEVDLFFLPRINIVEGITQEHINKWNWSIDDKKRINYPDYQGRLYRGDMLWVGKVHERIVGSKNFSVLPSDEEYSIFHYKTILKQEKQNNLYNSL